MALTASRASPIPAMSMVSYASGARYLSLIGGTCLSFYDWYCDLPPASPQTWGEQTDVPESADWYNSSYIIAWGSNVPQTRTPDAHFFTEVRYKGTKTVAVTPDYAEIAKLCDLWLAPKQGTDAAMALAMGHVMLREFHLDNPRQYFTDYVRRYTDMPMLVMLEERDGYYAAGRMLRAADLVDSLGQENNPEWKTVAINSNGEMVAPNGSIGFRWGEKANGISSSATGLPVQKLNCSSACWAAVMRLLKWASRISAAKVQSTLIMWRWITSCCTNCRLNVCNWPMVLPR